MLRIAPSSRPEQPAGGFTGERLSTQQTTLSVAWIDGSVRALAVHKGVVEGAWECPDPVTEADGFASVLRQAVTQTGYKGSTVSIVLAHPKLAEQLLEAPPMARTGFARLLERQFQMIMYLGMPPDLQPTLTRFINRQIQTLKGFEGEAAWSYEYTAPIENANGLLVHIFPRQILSRLVAECQQVDLRLTAVVPVTAVLQSQFRDLPIKPEEVAMLVGDTGRSTAIVVGRTDGQLYVSRVLAGSWGGNVQHLIVDLQRTALFVKEEFGVDVSSVWLFGPESRSYLATVQAETGIPAAESPVAWEPFYWARALCTLVPEMLPNLVTREQLHAPQEKLWLKFVAAGSIVLVLLCLGTTLYLESMVRNEQKELAALKSRLAAAEKNRQEVQQRNEELELKQEILKLVNEKRIPPVPAWFMGYLSEALPKELLLTSVNVRREGDLWRLKVTGTPQPGTNELTAAVFSNAVETFKTRLANGPFHVTFIVPTNAPPKQQPSKTAKAMPSWLAELGKSPPEPKDQRVQFEIEGVMQ